MTDLGYEDESLMGEVDAPTPLTDAYWAVEPPEDLVQYCMERVDRYTERLETSGRMALWRKAACTYYGADPGGGWANAAAVRYGGESGENVLLRANHFGNLVDHITALTTSNRLAAQARALGSGPEAASQVQLAESLVEYHLDGGLDREAVLAVRTALLTGEGHMACLWDVDGGPGSQPNGNLLMRSFHPIDVIRDAGWSSQDIDWCILRHRRNRWDMIALYPEWQEEIRGVKPFGSGVDHLWQTDMSDNQDDGDKDEIAVYEFFHRPSPAVPEGVILLFVENAPLRHGPNTYGKLPINSMCPIPELFSAFGFSRVWDLLGLSEALDSVISTMVTNHDAFGVQSVWTPPGSNIDTTDLGSGLVHIESTEPPQAVQLTSFPKESFQLAELLISTHETLSGVNSVARGNVPSNVRSGNALAMVHQVALQFNGALQAAYAGMMEAQFSGLVHAYQKFASGPMLVEIVGDDQTGYVKEFQAEDLQLVKRIAVDLGNPVLRSSAGRFDVASSWMERGLVKTPQEFLTFVTTGRLPELFRAPRAQAILIKRENEALRAGQPVKAILTDDHAAHVKEHAVELATPDVRWDDAVAGLILAHIQEHLTLATGMPPALAILTGQEGLLQIQAMMAAGDPAQTPAAQGAAGGAGAADGAKGGRPPGGGAPPGEEPNEALPNPVQNPTDPTSGEEYDPASGAGAPG